MPKCVDIRKLKKESRPTPVVEVKTGVAQLTVICAGSGKLSVGDRNSEIQTQITAPHSVQSGGLLASASPE